MTGIQRLAGSLISALDRELQVAGSIDRWVLICPTGAKPPALRYIDVVFCGPTFLGLHFWEQIFLPIYTIGSTLLNLAGPSPLLKTRQACFIPDAAVFDFPNAYSYCFAIWYRFLFRIIIRTAPLVVTISEFSKMRLISALGNNASRLKVIHCASTHMDSIDPDEGIISQLSLLDVPYLLAVSSVNPTKNLPVLIAAFKALKDSNIKLVLVGSRNAAVFANQQLDTNDPRIIIAGRVTDSELSALYLTACAFVFPSIYEGFGLPLLEAMSRGCPIVAANAASIPEVCGDAAFYFNPKCPYDLTRALEKIISDDDLRKQLIRLGTSRVKIFTWNSSARHLLRYASEAGLISK